MQHNQIIHTQLLAPVYLKAPQWGRNFYQNSARNPPDLDNSELTAIAV